MKKNILFISQNFFNFANEIEEEMIKQGYNVIRYDERVKTSLFFKVFHRLTVDKNNLIVDNYYSKIIDEIQKKNIDKLFVIKSEVVPKWFLIKIKDIFPNIQTILYLYDSIENYNINFDKIKYYDKCYTFDNIEAVKYNWKFHPLYFSNEIQNIGKHTKSAKLYDFSFVGTLHSDRAIFIQKINDELKTLNPTIYIYFFIQLKLLFLVGKYIKRTFRTLSMKDVYTTPLSYDKMLDIISKSSCIIDIHHPKQSGLTARTFEAIGSNRKLITTNREILNYDFYTANNILVVDKKNIKIPLKWVKTPFEKLDEQIYDKYTLKNFVNTILEN